jgi:hypothetical protein
MDNIILGATAAVIISLLTGFLSQRIISRQEAQKEALQKTAGIESIQVEKIPFGETVVDILDRKPPQRSMSVLAVTARALLENQFDLMEDILKKGVKVRILLMNPDSGVFWAPKDVSSKIKESILYSLEIIKRLVHANANVQTSFLGVKLYSQPIFESLLFIDDEVVFVSALSYMNTQSRLVYEISPGRQSIYNHYEQVFENIWSIASEYKF